MPTKKILITTDAWHPQINGVVTTLTQTIAKLRSYGHDLKVFTPESFRTFACPTYPEIRLSLTGKRSALKVLRDYKPDAVHIATEGPLGWAMWRACRTLAQPFTTSYHTRFPEYVRLRVPIPLAWSYTIVRMFHGNATRTMVATEDMARDLQEHRFKNLVRWSRGVDTDLFRPREKKFLSGERPIFMFVGRVAVEKNLEAFLSLDLAGTKYVVGDGPAFKELREKYPDVCFVGAKRGEELARHIAAADVFVFPSLTDTFGVVMLEAAACGVPVAAFPVTGPKNVIVEGVNGYLDTNLKTAIEKALTISPDSCRNFAKQYSWDVCSQQFYGNLAFA